MTYFNVKLLKNFMKLFLKIWIIFIFSVQAFASSEQIGVIGFVIGEVFNPLVSFKSFYYFNMI